MIDDTPPDATIYDGISLNLVADRLAEIDALLSFVVEAIQSNPSYSDMRRTVKKDLKEVKITTSINVDEYLAEQKSGFVALCKMSVKKMSGVQDGPVDYYRDDNGLPVIFESQADLLRRFNKMPDMELVRTIDLSEGKNE